MVQKTKRKKRKKKTNNIYKNQTQLVRATQPSSLHSAAPPRSSVKLPPLLSSSHRTARTSLQNSCFWSVPGTEPGSRRFVQPSPALPAAPMSQVPAVPPQQRVPSTQHWPPGTGGISGLPSPPQGSGQGLMPFLHTLLVTRVQEVIYKPIPSSERPIRH